MGIWFSKRKKVFFLIKKNPFERHIQPFHDEPRSFSLARRHWPIVQTLTVTMPTEVGIDSPQEFVEPQPVEWYGIDGKRVDLPQQRGVYIRKCGSRVQKVMP